MLTAEIPAKPSIDLTPVQSQNGEARIIMTNIIVENFKSYYGKKTLGPFHKSFTSIVGPNGSGKSNVIDSLLFVFGFKTNKLRQKKLSELIHSSAGAEDLPYCNVEIHFVEIFDSSDADSYQIKEGSEIIISRTAERKNERSTYRLNGKVVQYKQVQTLLLDKGVDLIHNRFLILQGEVESIAQMKPKASNANDDGLLEFLEDVIGSSLYKEDIKNLNTSVEELNQERNFKLQKVQVVQKEKEGLENGKNEAVKYIKLENYLAIKKNQLLQTENYELMLESNALHSELDKRISKLENLKLKLAEFKLILQDHQTKENVLLKDYDILKNKGNSFKVQLQNFENIEIQLREKIKFLKAKIKKNAKVITTEEAKLGEISNFLRTFQHDFNSKLDEIKDLSNKLAVEEKLLDEITEGLKDKTHVFQEDIEKKQMELAPILEELNVVNSGISVINEEKENLVKKITKVEVALNENKQQLQDLSLLKKEKLVTIKEIKSLKDSLLEKDNIIELEKKETELKKKLLMENDALQNKKTLLMASQTKGVVLRTLIQRQKEGRINGVYGRLGDLGTIDQKFDVAISTCCKRLDNIIVSKVEIGQKCIKILKDENLGRAAFICLDVIKKFTKDDMAGNFPLPRLFDLVKPKEEKFVEPFYLALGNTLVAKDLREAKQVAFGKTRYRVVTLDGQLIEASGTMSGGGNKISKGGMSSSFKAEVSKKDILILEEEFNASKKSLEDCRMRLKELESEKGSVEKELTPLELESQKVELDLNRLEENMKEIETICLDLQSEDQPDKQDMDRLTFLNETSLKKSKILSGIEGKKNSIESAIKLLHEEILRVGGTKLRVQKSKTDGLIEQIKYLEELNLKSQVENQLKIKKEKKIIENLTLKKEEQINTENEILSVDASVKENLSKLEELKCSYNEIEEEISEKEAELSEFRKDFELKNNEITALKHMESNLRNFVDEKKKRIEDLNHWKIQNEKEISELKVQCIELEEEEEMEDLIEFEEDELKKFDKEILSKDIEDITEKLEKLQPNLQVLEEYKEKLMEFKTKSRDLLEITNNRDEKLRQFELISQKRLDEFMTGFKIISQKLKEMYQMITLGGNAELELVDSLDPFSEGIIFSVMPPKKSWKNISNLSGGEKTLSSLALVFALHHYKPTPLYVMDEIDAALDFRNVSIVANYIKERTKNAQFLIISLRNNMFELADRLVGIYKTDNKTKCVTINPKGIHVM
ncbi:hypothetical protein HK099_004197 [Clydaea vesicula]|uniref:Structural maintenance of chromosomes protein n=1 Tax=Clydaea vesicula TaxID=447962 RepID=A0AAD5U0K0_9FUNG|nr:hypothetical protein HK099_004197 [Clydaea vesicula]